MFIFDWIAIPFGYAMDFLYRLTNNYGASVILFSLLVSLVMHPIHLRNAVNSYKKKRLAPHVTTIRGMYPKNVEMQNRMMEHMYQKEKVNLAGGCLLNIVPIIILISMFCVLYSPFQFIYHLDEETAIKLTQYIRELNPTLFENSRGYSELIAAQHISEYAEQIKIYWQAEGFVALPERIFEGINFNFFGINLAAAPQLDFTKWEKRDWGTIGLFMLPILTAITQTLPSLITYVKNLIAAFKKKNTAMTKNPASWMKLVSIILTLVISFIVPGALSLYWLTKSVAAFGLNTHIRSTIKKLPPDTTDLKELERISAEELEMEASAESDRKTLAKQDGTGFTEYAE